MRRTRQQFASNLPDDDRDNPCIALCFALYQAFPAKLFNKPSIAEHALAHLQEQTTRSDDDAE